MKSDLSSPSYWDTRQHKLHAPRDKGAIRDLLDTVEPFLREYKSQRWIELGSSPGHISCLLYRRIKFLPFGIDYSPQAHLYSETMASYANITPTLFQTDIREFIAPEPFDVVMSYGLVEHFEDPEEVLDFHYKYCRKGGLIVVTIPHFRYLQFSYHYLFDRSDLSRHNVAMMNLETFKTFAKKQSLEVCFLGYVGRINFWNVDETGPRVLVILRKGLSIGFRLLTNNILSHILPRNKKLYAPWIVFVARKTG
jgi:trans-aconitate methyltransferase